MRRVRLGTLIGVGLLAAGVAAVAPAGAQNQTCSQLTGEVLVDGPTVKVVRQTAGVNDNVIRGCVLPDGPVRRVAYEQNEDGILTRFEVEQTVGRFLVSKLDVIENRDGGSSRTFRYIQDLASGRNREIRPACRPDFPGNPGRPAARELIGADGRFVQLATCADGRTVLRGLPPRGGVVFLDVAPKGTPIPPESVTLDGRNVSWVRGDRARSGRL